MGRKTDWWISFRDFRISWETSVKLRSRRSHVSTWIYSRIAFWFCGERARRCSISVSRRGFQFYLFVKLFCLKSFFFVVKEVDDVASLSSFVDFLLVQFSSQIIYSCMYWLCRFLWILNFNLIFLVTQN